jgi:hypothetical protein
MPASNSHKVFCSRQRHNRYNKIWYLLRPWGEAPNLGVMTPKLSDLPQGG